MGIFYVLTRGKKSKDPLRDSKTAEAVGNVLARYDMDPRKLFPSEDGKRYIALRVTPLPETELTPVQAELGELFFNLEGPFRNYESAMGYWKDGTKP